MHEELHEEVLNSVKSFAQTGQAVVDLINKLKGSDKDVPHETPVNLTKTDTSFTFTGQSTDLSYFQNNNVMPIDFIEKIPDENIKNAVKEEFNKAALDGKLTIDPKNGTVTVTDKGKKFISKPAFQKATAINLQNLSAQQAQSMCFELNGTAQDLNYFKFSDKLDLTEIFNNSDTATVKKVADNLQKMKDSGLIAIEKSTAKLTEKGANVLNDKLFQVATQGATEKSLAIAGGVPGVIVAVTKKLVSAVTQSAVSSK